MLDAHADALDELHKKLTDKMAGRLAAKHGKKPPAHVVAVMSKTEEPEPEPEPETEADGDEAEGEEEPASPRASAALKLLQAIRGKR